VFFEEGWPKTHELSGTHGAEGMDPKCPDVNKMLEAARTDKLVGASLNFGSRYVLMAVLKAVGDVLVTTGGTNVDRLVLVHLVDSESEITRNVT
jgi:hypothetical protein